MLEEGLGEEQENFKVIYTYEVKSKVENKAAQVEVKDETFTVYISGIDVYGAIETNSRSDVNILAVVNPNTHQVLPGDNSERDYYVQIPGILRRLTGLQLTHMPEFMEWMRPCLRWGSCIIQALSSMQE
ncbi:MAG: hypothetical protein ACLU7M_03400 [Mediterraneibacter gnavus]